MKKLFIVSFVLIMQLGNAQKVEESIERSFKEYVALTHQLKFDEAMNYVIDDLFDLVPKEQLIATFIQIFNSEDYDIEFVDYYANNFKKPFVYKGATYVVFTNNMTNKMRFNFFDENNSDDDKLNQLNFLKQTFISSYGKENVKLDEKTGFFTLFMKKAVCAKSSNGKTDWKFLNIEEDKKSLFKKILPKKVFRLAKI